MSRTTVEVPMKTNNVDAVLHIIAAKLEPAGYQRKIVGGESVWAKGDSVIVKMQCVKAEFTGRSVLIQGWMKDAITGESNLDGFVAIFQKKKIKGLINEICTVVTSSNL